MTFEPRARPRPPGTATPMAAAPASPHARAPHRRRPGLAALLSIALPLIGVTAHRAGAAEGTPTENAPPPADRWLGLSDVAWPGHRDTIAADRFSSLTGTAQRRRLVVMFPAPEGGNAATVRYSVDAPGHWESRDWRTVPMVLTNGQWLAEVPVSSADIPIVYGVSMEEGTRRVTSPLRLFDPRAAGLVQPTAPFSGFVEGFEGGLEGWEVASGSAGAPELALSTEARTGRHALRVEIPEGRGSVTVGTVRLRGWMLEEHLPTGLRLMARTTGGTARVRCLLHAHARSETLSLHPLGGEPVVGSGWSRLEWPLGALPGVPVRDVDWLTFQFLAEPGTVVLLDDLELVVRWEEAGGAARSTTSR